MTITFDSTIDPTRFAAALPEHARYLAPGFLAVAGEFNLNPFVLATLVRIESNYGLALRDVAHPNGGAGPGGTGDFDMIKGDPRRPPRSLAAGGYGLGLMQIDRQVTLARVAHFGDWRDPLVNLRMGASLLGEARQLFSSTTSDPCGAGGGKVVITSGANVGRDGTTRLQWPVGIFPDPRPLFGEALFNVVVIAHNAGNCGALRGAAIGKPAHGTYRGSYLTAFQSRMGELLARY